MSNIVVYDISGKFRNVSAPPDMLVMQCQDGEAFLIGSGNPELEYVHQGEITPRPTQSTAIDKTTIQANGVDLVQITGIPTDATLTAKNKTTGDTVSGPVSGSDSFYSSIAGIIELTITKWPYLDWSATIEAV